MSKAWRLVSVCFAIVLAAYFVYFAVRAADLALLKELVLAPKVAAATLVGSTLYALIVPVSAWAWRRLLEVQGEEWRFSRLAVIIGIAQFAKYVPGNVAQHAARVTLSMRSGMRFGPYLASVAQETVLTVFASVLVGISTLVLAGRSLSHISPYATGGLVVGSVTLVAVVAVLSSVRLDSDYLSARSSRIFQLLGKMGGLPGPSITLSCILAYSVNYLVIGAGLWLVAQSIGAGGGLGYMLLTSVFSLSWVLGFLVPGAPAGFGAREGVMLVLLQGSADNETVVAFILMARVVTMLGDVICLAASGAARALSVGSGVGDG